LLSGCASSPTAVRKAIEEDPSIVFDALSKDPLKFTEMLQKSTREAQKLAQARGEKEEAERIEREMKTPLQPKISDERASRGDRKSSYQIVVYSDFQCPYCQKGYEVVEDLKKMYKEKLFFTFKHLPLDFHPMAMPAAKRFEAIALQSADKAYRFHDEVFKGQNRLGSEGEKFLDEVAKKVGANLTQMRKDLNSDRVRERIADDMREASAFGIQGTPGFIVAGVALKGAYPAETFRSIFEKRGLAAQ